MRLAFHSCNNDACYARNSRDWVCGSGGVFVDQLRKLKLCSPCRLTEEQRVLLDAIAQIFPKMGVTQQNVLLYDQSELQLNV